MTKPTFFISSALLLLLLNISLYSQVTTLSGNAPTYANDQIMFYSFSDPVTYTQQEVGSCKVNEKGDFTCTINNNKTMYIFSHLEVYIGYLFIEPGQEYTIVLPTKIEKTPEEKMNPYFEETVIQIGVTKSDEQELNFLIRLFEDSFRPYFNKFALNFYSRTPEKELDSAVESIQKPFAEIDHRYFNRYKEYKLASLYYLASQYNYKKLATEYFKDRPVAYFNPAYMDLFHQVFDRYFSYFAQSNPGKNLYYVINESRDPVKLKEILSADKVLENDTLMELVILKNLMDECYSTTSISKDAIIALLDGIKNTSAIPMHQEIAQNIKRKITKLMTGYEAPFFELYDLDSNLVKLSDFKESYIYLNFCLSNNFACIQELELVKSIHEKHKDKLKVITIAADEDLQKLKKYVAEKQYEWTFLHIYNQPGVLTDYNIRAFPTYYLIGPGNELLLAPAPSPAENFEMYLFNIMRSKGDI